MANIEGKFEVLRLTGGKRSVRKFPPKAIDPGIKMLAKVQQKILN